jgi:hypothetical protein
LLKGGKQRQDYDDFVSRYDQGHPSEGYSDQEVVQRYREVAHQVPPDQYAQAAQDALARMSPEERAEFASMLQQRAQARGVSLPNRIGSNPDDLGRVLSNLHQTPGRLSGMLGADASDAPAAGGGMAGMLGSPLAKAALAGIAAMVVRKAMNR